MNQNKEIREFFTEKGYTYFLTIWTYRTSFWVRAPESRKLEEKSDPLIPTILYFKSEDWYKNKFERRRKISVNYIKG